jgi:hypothetical protein
MLRRVTLVKPTFRRNVFSRGQSRLLFIRSVLRLIVIANVPSSPILVTPMMVAIYSSETSVLIKDS